MTSVADKRVFELGAKTLIALEPELNNILCAANKNGLTKVLKTNNPEEEPEVIDIVKNLTSVKCLSESKFLLTSINGDAFIYDIKTSKQHLLTRSGLPLRDSAVIHMGKMVILGGDDLELTMINLDDTDSHTSKTTITIDEQVSQLSYSSKTNLLALSFINGVIQFFSLSSTKPNKVKQLDGYIFKNSYDDNFTDNILNSMGVSNEFNDSDSDLDDGNLNSNDYKVKDPEFCDENRICTRVAWHPSGLYFAIPCNDSTIKIFTLKDYSLMKSLSVKEISKNKFIDLQFDPLHGKYVASVDLNNNLIVWDWKTSQIHYERQFKQNITNFTWKFKKEKTQLDILLGTWSGDVITVNGVVESVELNNPDDKQSSSTITSNGLFVMSDDDDDNIDSDIDNLAADKIEDNKMIDNMADDEEEGDADDINSDNLFTPTKNDKKRKLYADEDDDNIDAEDDDDDIDGNANNFIEDDDGAGYVIHNKKPNSKGNNNHYKGKGLKFSLAANNIQSSFAYKPISPGGTPFGNDDRRYLTMNNIGYVSTVRNSEQHSITVSFFDIGKFSEYHFEDLFGFNLCYLSERGALFAQSKTGQLHFRPHDTLHSNWTRNIPLNRGEIITSTASTPKIVVIGTSFGYVRIFNQFGIPLTVERMSPIVSLTVNEYRIFIVHYSPTHGIAFSLFEQTPTKSVYYHRESSLPIPLPNSGSLQTSEYDDVTFNNFNPIGIKSLFFSEYGDPCVFGNDNVLLILSKWRTTKESRWIPILDTNMEVWKMTGGKTHANIHVWPLGLTYDTLNCILVKGRNGWPGFPLPLPSEMEVRMPILVKKQLWDGHQARKAQEDDDELANGNGDDNNVLGGINNENKEIEVSVELAAEEEFIRSKVLADLLTDTLENDGEIYGNENEILASLNGAYDKALLRLFASACSAQDSDKALSLVQELKQDRALTAAAKISERAEMLTLMRRINEIREARFEQQMDNV